MPGMVALSEWLMEGFGIAIPLVTISMLMVRKNG
jgi:type IV secretory pathway TrbD component